jgi:hypothetical protein
VAADDAVAVAGEALPAPAVLAFARAPPAASGTEAVMRVAAPGAIALQVTP